MRGVRRQLEGKRAGEHREGRLRLSQLRRREERRTRMMIGETVMMITRQVKV